MSTITVTGETFVASGTDATALRQPRRDHDDEFGC
jgi:hypothetical protein